MDDEQKYMPPEDVRRERRSLAVALVVAAVFLLASVGLATWLLTRPPQEATSTSGNTEETALVKKVSLVMPSTIPDSYAKREENIRGTQRTYYYDESSSCRVTPMVVEDTEISAAQTAKNAVKSIGDSNGIKTATSADIPSYTLKDAQDDRSYTFPAIQMEQTVAVPGVPFKAQRTIIAFKQFGTSVALVTASCKTEVWNDKKAQLEHIVKSVTVKTER